jgi:prepilin-type N-terminal cleavage/methylation domain-containing protein
MTKSSITSKIRSDRGVTLLELIVVILILGLIGAVAYRTIDATTYQSRFDSTKKEMLELVKGFVGNPDLVSDGKRMNFGYVGNMGRMPTNLTGLIKSDGTNWQGPYIPVRIIQDSTDYRTDAWGNSYVYDANLLTIRSTAGGRIPLTVKVADTITDLLSNRLTGVVADKAGLPPAELASRIRISLTVPQNGSLVSYNIHPRADGYYEFAPSNYPVPIGLHRLVAKKEFGSGDSVIRWVSVLPRSIIISDLKFASGFHDNLKYVEGSGVAYPDSTTNNIRFSVFNSGDDVTLDSMAVIGLDTTAYYEYVNWQGCEVWDMPSHGHRAGIGEVINLNPRPVIPRNTITRFDILGFKQTRMGNPPPVSMVGRRIVIRFSDGSIIEFVPVASP